MILLLQGNGVQVPTSGQWWQVEGRRGLEDCFPKRNGNMLESSSTNSDGKYDVQFDFIVVKHFFSQ